MSKHQIKHRFTGAALFECEVPDNVTSGLRTRHALEKAVEARADLADADLAGAYLAGANETVKPATNEQAIENLDKVRAIVMDDRARLHMGHWHGDEDWKDRTCAEETLCGTTHCMAGWLQVCSTDPAIRGMPPQRAGLFAAPIASKMFFRDSETAYQWLESRQYVQDIADHERMVAERRARKAATQEQAA